ncbi:PDZ domain-containing protein 8 isoform X2 [Bacillus rossius redtenbacheri]|uniref:PDZ domain-containing protein 8 isoform X2 n=1 Tax=Bacillus rossius redtenbacheri TaxID=93214 RepID=UPI002FDF0862
MDVLLVLFLMLLSLVAGILLTVAAQWFLFSSYVMRLPYVGPPAKPFVGQVRLPQMLIEALQSIDVPKKESCVAINLLFQFLFKELATTQKVRRWFRHKLSSEFEELLTRTTTGKLFDKVTIRDIHLGTHFPAVKSITVKDTVIHEGTHHLDLLELCVDLEYSGGFQLSIDANMLLGKAAFLSVKVNHLSGLARLQFSRHPYTHWSFSFYSDPVLELQVESQFQGRPLPQINSIIVSQIRKSLKKKHTLPYYKLRYKPFFAKCEPGEGEDEWASHTVCPGTLQVTVAEVTRLMACLVQGPIYCSLAVDSLAWVEMFHSETSSYVTLDLTVRRRSPQPLGLVFKQQFVSDRYQACVLVESVAPGSPAAAADVRRCDVLVAVDGRKVGSMAQAARLVKGAGERFTLRVERKLACRLQLTDKDIIMEQDGDPPALKVNETMKSSCQSSVPGSPVLGRAGLRQRRGSGDKTESDSSSSSPASVPSSPARKPSVLNHSNQSSPEHQAKASDKRYSLENRDERVDVEGTSSFLQIHRTKEIPFCQVMQFEETVSFHVAEDHRYLNVSVWSKAGAEGAAGKQPPSPSPRGERDVLLGHVSIPLAAIAAECGCTSLGHHIKSFSLLPPDPHTAMSQSHKLSSHSGFEPCLCYGDILLSFQYASRAGSGPARLPVTPSEAVLPLPLPQPGPAVDPDRASEHVFIRTHFHRTTQCEFCGKKIWLKDAVQCQNCSMTCHKKCVVKCQSGTVCGVQRRASTAPTDTTAPDHLGVPPQSRRGSAQPEIITTAADDDEYVQQAPGHRRRIGSLLATVASAAQSRGLKRAGSAHSLALPTSASCSHLSRSLPPSPQRSPGVSRKASLAGSPFQFPHSPLDDDVSAALEHLLQHPNDEDLMNIAKSTGKDLYASLSLTERKEKINSMIVKLKAAMDAETQSRMQLAREEQENKDPETSTRVAFLIGKSDQRVQALAVLMLHFCAGLQHTQDQDESNKEGVVRCN